MSALYQSADYVSGLSIAGNIGVPTSDGKEGAETVLIISTCGGTALDWYVPLCSLQCSVRRHKT